MARPARLSSTLRTTGERTECRANKVYAKLRYHGYHRGELLGHQPTGRHVWWYGAPFFTFEGEKIRDLWVLGDIHGLLKMLK